MRPDEHIHVKLMYVLYIHTIDQKKNALSVVNGEEPIQGYILCWNAPTDLTVDSIKIK